jgi:ATP-dependent protease Clp, ATPase subunit
MFVFTWHKTHHRRTTAISFARGAEVQDHGVHETELRRPRLSCDNYRAGASGRRGGEKPEKTDTTEFEFHLLPRDIKAHLDRFVIKQEEAKKVLAIAVCDHYNHANYLRRLEKEDPNRAQEIEYIKQNVILVGPTGVGKTYLIKHIADLIKVPFVKADATKFSETGYVGGDVEDLVRELVHKADGDEPAQFGIIYIDEIDKIASAEI